MNGSPSLTLCIGGFTLKISDVGGSRLFARDPRERFLSQGEPDINVRCHYGEIPTIPPGALVAVEPQAWELHRVGPQWWVRTGEAVQALCSDDFTSIDVFVGPGVDTPYPILKLEPFVMVNVLARDSGLMVHSLGVNDRCEGLLFVGNSGAGKTTLARLWEKRSECLPLCDERVIVRLQEGRFWIYGTPYAGSARRFARPDRAPLKKIFLLRHSATNRARRLDPSEAAVELMSCGFLPRWSAGAMTSTLDLAGRLCSELPCYELGFEPLDGAVDYIRRL